MEDQERLTEALADRYRITQEIGRGGMATVYLAQDLKHDRQVAVKVLKPELAATLGTERFLAEIRTTANLSHPHILPLHDSGEADGFLFYTMPYVEGESLRERLDRGGQLPVEEGVSIAGHVADALESAHNDGVIHRDLKPANILFQKGEPVVADFGIALAVSAAGEGRLTETGLSLGTPYYMSPEQAAGDQIPTAASDVYSLGCVLYEMLTGDPPHTGSSAQAILGKILLGEVTHPTALRRTIPANVEGAILKALERIPADRFGSVAELAAALKDKSFRHGAGEPAGIGTGPWRAMAMGFGALALLTTAALVTTVLQPAPPPPPALHQRIHPPGDGTVHRYVALAPDGSSMVYRDTVGLDSGWQLWVKDRGSGEGRPLAGTTGARDVVYSPDGEWIAYKVGASLVKRPIQGTGSVVLLEGVDLYWPNLDWMADGTLLSDQGRGTLVRVSDNGGGVPDTVRAVSDPIIWIQGLPGGNAALVVTCPEAMCVNGTVFSVVDLIADTAHVLLNEAMRAWYIPTGHIVWVSLEGRVFATSFDLGRLEMADAHEPLFEGVRVWPHTADMVVGGDGTALLAEGVGYRSAMGGGELVWVDRSGQTDPFSPEWDPGLYHSLALSPDRQRLAVSSTMGPGGQIWVTDLPHGPFTQLTTNDGLNIWPTWAPDGSTIAFASNEGGRFQIRSVPSDGRLIETKQVLVSLPRAASESVYTPDGQGLLFRSFQATVPNSDDIGYLDLATGTVTEEFLATEFSESGMAISPNGRWLAYTSGIFGSREELFVRPFPDIGAGRTQVSRNGGTGPTWARNGREIFFRDGEGWMTSAVYSADSVFNVVSLERLFDARPFRHDISGRTYDFADSDERFLMLQLESRDVDEGGVEEPRLIQILNWFTELEERLGGGS